MITTTLTRIRNHSPRQDIWRKLLAGLGNTAPDDEPLPFAKIVEINGIEYALWCCRAEPQHAKEWRLFAVWCARQVQYLMKDPRSIAALDVAERYANGQATDDELDTAECGADVARDAAEGAEWAAAWAAAWSATAERTAAWAAEGAASLAAEGAAREAAGASARAAAWYAAMAAQKAKFLEVVS